MPNWTTNYLEIRGDKQSIEDLLKAVRYDEPENEAEVGFDFNGIIPMPEALSIESGSNSSAGFAAFDDGEFKKLLGYPWFKEKHPKLETREQYAEWLKSAEPETYSLGEQVADNVVNHGAKDWYEWRNQRWGVKWNAIHATEIALFEDRVALMFDTPWCDPMPIFDALTESGFTIRAVSIHESGGDPTLYGDDAYEAFEIRTEVDYVGC